MAWNNEKVLILLKEVAVARPFQYRSGTRERGKVWAEVAERLQDLHNLKVDTRSVRDRVSQLMNKRKNRNRKEKAASGIAPKGTAEEASIREILEEFIAKEEDVESMAKVTSEEEQKRKAGLEIRKRACETLGETSKR